MLTAAILAGALLVAGVIGAAILEWGIAGALDYRRERARRGPRADISALDI